MLPSKLLLFLFHNRAHRISKSNLLYSTCALKSKNQKWETFLSPGVIWDLVDIVEPAVDGSRATIKAVLTNTNYLSSYSAQYHGEFAETDGKDLTSEKMKAGATLRTPCFNFSAFDHPTECVMPISILCEWFYYLVFWQISSCFYTAKKISNITFSQ